ncbi:hypothetical protein V502_07739 [Pseudogymnoascus sp. VKM F-4520 (FW-2644)]|nr:hypothetical protein V502_07739 [Pseudogymnoascus sp. VKM F-4520 (FW-2644)]
MMLEDLGNNDCSSQQYKGACDVRRTSSQDQNNSSELVCDATQTDPAVEYMDALPDGGYGWVVVICVAIINIHTWGAYSVFLAHYLDTDTFHGATALEFAFVGGLSIGMCQAVAPICTVTTRLWGTRCTLFIGIVLQTAALLGASWSTTIWHLFLSQGICFGFGMGFQYNATAAIIPQWFAKKRSFATSLGSAGSGLGGLIYCLAASSIIQSMGPGWAFRILAIVSAAANTACAAILRDRNKEVGTTQIAFDWSLLRRWEYCLTVAWGAFSIMTYIVLLFSLPAYARSIGLTAQQGSVVGAMLNLAQAIGRPIIGLSSDKFGRLNVALVGSFLPAIFTFALWIPAKSYSLLIFSSLILGLTIGTFWTTVAPVNAEVVGLEHLSSALSIFWPLLIIPTVFAEPIALELRQSKGNIYIHGQVFTGFMFIGATLCIWRVRAWKKEHLKAQKGQQESGGNNDVLGSQNNRNRTKSRWVWIKL